MSFLLDWLTEGPRAVVLLRMRPVWAAAAYELKLKPTAAPSIRGELRGLQVVVQWPLNGRVEIVVSDPSGVDDHFADELIAALGGHRVHFDVRRIWKATLVRIPRRHALQRRELVAWIDLAVGLQSVIVDRPQPLVRALWELRRGDRAAADRQLADYPIGRYNLVLALLRHRLGLVGAPELRAVLSTKRQLQPSELFAWQASRPKPAEVAAHPVPVVSAVSAVSAVETPSTALVRPPLDANLTAIVDALFPAFRRDDAEDLFETAYQGVVVEWQAPVVGVEVASSSERPDLGRIEVALLLAGPSAEHADAVLGVLDAPGVMRGQMRVGSSASFRGELTGWDPDLRIITIRAV